jgi:Fur family peroxide stress response transcriptional regulator
MPEPNVQRDETAPARRMTRQKRAIYENVMNRCDHPTAQEIHQDLAASGIGLATVYRNLATLARDGVISTVEHEGELRYDCNNEAHGHATCTACGRLWDIPLPAPHDTIEASGLVDVEQVELTLRGVCTSCA